MVFAGFATDRSFIPYNDVCPLQLLGHLLAFYVEIFWFSEQELVSHTNLVDAEPREVYIVSALLD